MTQFAAVLKAAMTDEAITQEALAEMTGSSQSSLSRILQGHAPPSAVNLEKICREFPDNVREALTAAYLTDQIPPSAVNLVSVMTVREMPEERMAFQADRAPAGSLLYRNLRIIERHALKDPSTAAMIDYLAAMVQGIAPSPDYFEPPTEGTSVREDPRLQAAKKKLGNNDHLKDG